MSSFAISGRIVFDPARGPTAFVHAVATNVAGGGVEIRRGVGSDADPRMHLLELVAALALEIRGRGDEVSAVDVD